MLRVVALRAPFRIEFGRAPLRDPAVFLAIPSAVLAS